jgi:hypothetical protein
VIAHLIKPFHLSQISLNSSVAPLFGQLKLVLEQLNPEDYAAPNVTLINATIGQHVRHIIELFQALQQGYAGGVIDYDGRPRNQLIETQPLHAIACIDALETSLQMPDKPLLLMVEASAENATPIALQSNYHRELLYNIEHAVHHMAIIKMGLQSARDIVLPPSFGLAVSTIKYRAACAQ